MSAFKPTWLETDGDKKKTTLIFVSNASASRKARSNIWNCLLYICSCLDNCLDICCKIELICYLFCSGSAGFDMDLDGGGKWTRSPAPNNHGQKVS